MSTKNVDKSKLEILSENKCKKCNEEQFSQCPDNPCKYHRQLPPPISSTSSSSLENSTKNNLFVLFDYDRVSKYHSMLANIMHLPEDDPGLFRLACSYGNPDHVKLLLENDIDIRVQDDQHGSAILNAIRGGCTHVIDLLIQYGCDINELKCDKYERIHNYLYFAIDENKPKMVKYLLHLGFDPNSPYGSIDVDNFTNNPDILELMLIHGANMEKMSKEKKTLASCIMKDKRRYKTTDIERWFQLLIKYVGLERSEKHEYSISGRSLMHIAIYRNNIYYVDYLLKHGFDLNCRELGTNNTVLHIAVARDMDLMKTLLEYGAMIDAIDCNGDTALHLAVKNHKYQNIRDLLLFGARFNIVNCGGKTAVDLAIDYDDEKSIEWMLLFGAKVEEIERLLDANSDVFLTKIREMLVRYEIKIKILKNNQDLNVGIDVELNKFKDECMKELDIIKSLKILNVEMDCFDLLFANERKLVKLASENSKDKMMKFYDRHVNEKLPIYRNMFWKKINFGYVYESVYDKAIRSLNNIVDSKLPLLVLENVINYLNYLDMKNLIKCFLQFFK